MSERSEEVGEKLYVKLNVSGVTSLATGGVYQDEVPEAGADDEPVIFPYVFFTRVAAKDVIRSLGNTIHGEDDLWLIKALTDKRTSGDYSPRRLGALILTACETAIGESLSLDEFTAHLVRRVRDFPLYLERADGRAIYHQGFYLRVFTE